MKCILHIGLPKTASTYLQRHVFSHISAQCPRLIYDKPVFDKLFKHVEECFVHDHKPLKPHLANLRGHLLRLEKEHPEKVLLVSREQIASLHHIRYEEYHEAVREAFSGLDPRVLIVARYQPDWLWSLYKHTVGKAGSLSPEEFYRMEGRGEETRFSYHTGADPLERDFWALYERYSAWAGETNLKFFEHFVEDEATFVDAVFAGCGLEYDRSWPRRRTNPTMPDRVVGFYLAFCMPAFGFELEAHEGEALPRLRNGMRRVANAVTGGWNGFLLRQAGRLPEGLLERFAREQVFYREELKSRFDRRNRERSAALGITPPARYTDGNHTKDHVTRQKEQTIRTS